MPLLLAALVFACVMAVVALVGMKLWVKPKEAIERVTGVGMTVQEQAPAHPSLAFRELLQRIGNAIPASPADANVVQKRLIRAGIRSPNALKILYGSKVILAIVLPLIMTALVSGSSAPTENKFLAVMAAVEGMMWSGLVVPTKSMSMSSPDMPARSSFSLARCSSPTALR